MARLRLKPEPKIEDDAITVFPPVDDQLGTIDFVLGESTTLVARYGEASVLANFLAGLGFLHLSRIVGRAVPKKIGYVDGLEVAEANRGRGIGSAMLRRAVGIMADAGVSAVYLHFLSGQLSDAEALDRFYRRLGWKQISGSNPGFYPIYKLHLRS